MDKHNFKTENNYLIYIGNCQNLRVALLLSSQLESWDGIWVGRILYSSENFFIFVSWVDSSCHYLRSRAGLQFNFGL